MPSLESTQLLQAAVDACDSKKAEDIVILALDPSESSLTDYFLICNGTNERQNAAIADEIEFRLKNDFGVYPNSVEGRRQGEWVLMDYVDFVVHIFLPEKRAYYGLERLRRSARTLTSGELNAEIKAALAKTRAKSPAIKRPAADEGPGTSGSASGKMPMPKPAVKKAVAKKAPAATKVVAAKKVAAKKAPVKAAPAKAAPAKKTVAKKAVATEAVAAKAVARNAVAKKAAPVKAAAKKASKKAAKKS